MLYSVTGRPANRRQWCGPSAICIITGLQFTKAVELLRSVKARRRPSLERVTIKGASYEEMTTALRHLGYEVVPLAIETGTTFAAWLRGRPEAVRKEVVLVCAGQHYMVVQGRKAACGKTGEPVFTSKMPGRRSRMARAWIVRKVADTQATTKTVVARVEAAQEAQTAAQRVRAHERACRVRQARYLAKKFHLTITDDGNELLIDPPEGYLLDDLSQHVFIGPDRWEAALERLQYWEKWGTNLIRTVEHDGIVSEEI